MGRGRQPPLRGRHQASGGTTGDAGGSTTVEELAGLVLAFALQSILEDFIAGVLILVRMPSIEGHQIISGELEGTVDDIDLRVTRSIPYDGQ